MSYGNCLIGALYLWVYYGFRGKIRIQKWNHYVFPHFVHKHIDVWGNQEVNHYVYFDIHNIWNCGPLFFAGRFELYEYNLNGEF